MKFIHNFAYKVENVPFNSDDTLRYIQNIPYSIKKRTCDISVRSEKGKGNKKTDFCHEMTSADPFL